MSQISRVFLLPILAILIIGAFRTGKLLSKSDLPVNSTNVVDQQNDSADIMNLLQERDKEIKELLGSKGTEYTQEKRNQLKDIINGVIDYEAMASFALQTTYDTLSQKKKDEFVNVFSKIVRDQSLSNLDIYRAEIAYKKIDVVEDSAWVETLSQLENVNTPVYYVMKEQKDNWKVIDFYVDDVSTAKSYRRSFQNVIRKRDFEYLLETLRKRAGRN